MLQTRQELERARAQLEKALNGTREEEIRRLHQQHQEAVAALALAEKTHARCRVLHAQQAVSTQRYDEAVNALTQARARERAMKAALEEAVTGSRQEDIAAARAATQALEARLQEVESMARDVELRSPVDGEISKVLVDVGELVAPGYPLVTLIELDDLWMVIQIREDQLQDVRMGRLLVGQIPALSGKKVVFRVDYMAPLGNYATWRATNNSDSFDLKTFEVRGRPVKPVPGLRPGMSVIFAWPFDPAMEDGH